MKIKNTKELQLRANAHARADHIKQGTYGDGSVNGKIKYEGCAVGCLSTPHRQRELRAFLKDGHPGEWSDVWMREQLGKEFGITPWLACAAEGFFEGQKTHGAAINFVRDFAHALPEGANIRPREVKSCLVRFGAKERMDERACWSPESYEPIERIVSSKTTQEFLEWLKSRG